MAKAKFWRPGKGQIYKSRDEIEQKLLDAGWSFEGHGMGIEDGKVASYDVGVIAGAIWLWVDMVPCSGGVRVTRVRELPASPKQQAAADKAKALT